MLSLSKKNIAIPEKRFQFDFTSGKLVHTPKKQLFLRGPVPLDWLGKAAKLPGKTLNVALAIWWLKGMTHNESFKLTRMSLNMFSIKRDAASMALNRLEGAGLISIKRVVGQRPCISIIHLNEIENPNQEVNHAMVR